MPSSEQKIQKKIRKKIRKKKSEAEPTIEELRKQHLQNEKNEKNAKKQRLVDVIIPKMTKKILNMLKDKRGTIRSDLVRMPITILYLNDYKWFCDLRLEIGSDKALIEISKIIEANRSQILSILNSKKLYFKPAFYNSNCGESCGERINCLKISLDVE